MNKNAVIIVIAICAAIAIAGAIAAVSMNNGNNSNNNSNDNGSSDNGGNNSTAATMNGITVLYDGLAVGDSILIEKDDVSTVMDKITAVAKYSDGTTKSITGYTKNGDVPDEPSIGDSFTVTVSYGEYTKTVTVKIVEMSVDVKYESGTEDCYTVERNDNGEYTITFSGMTADSVYSISGNIYGNIVIDAGDDYDFELSLTGLTIQSRYEVPLYISSGNNVVISAKNGTVNSIGDLREEVDELSSCIYSVVDLDIQGKGTLNVTSENNNGIHTKDDLSVKNLTLYVKCVDNALKGNDSVTVKSGTITLIATKGDGIKTTNSDISSKSVQRGTISLNSEKGDLTMNIYAACDGIDASYNVEIYEEDGNTVTLNIYTDKYSEYSEEVTEVSDDVYYIRNTSQNYSYSLYYYNSSSDYVWKDASYLESSQSQDMGRGTTYYYYTVEKLSGYSNFKLYMYNSSQSQGQDSAYAAFWTSSINESFDMFSINGSRCSWSSYSGGSGSMSGMDEGNTDKGEYSTKGIKADNVIYIKSGTVFVKSYDDAIHANSGSELENGAVGLGDIEISGGSITLYSNDDGIHGDGDVSISGGSVDITHCYEGVEGEVVTVSGGSLSIVSSDDGINGTSTSGQSIIISGGYLYVYAGGDGLDANSTSSYNGILFSGGTSVIIATSQDNSAIDTERGYKYTGGKVLAIGCGGGMSNESTNCSNLSSVGKSVTKSLTKGTYVIVDSIVSLKMPCALNANIVYLGSNSVSISTASSGLGTDDDNGVCWV